MGRSKHVRTPKDIIGGVLAQNLTQKMHKVFGDAGNETAQIKALSGRSGVGKETVRRIISCSVSPRLDIIHKIAQALGTTAAELIATTIANEARTASRPSRARRTLPQSEQSRAPSSARLSKKSRNSSTEVRRL